MLRDCKTLDDYFARFGGELGARANQALAPLHLPSRDPVHPAIGTLLRRPFDAQAHVITAAVKAWQRQKSVLLACEMGTGKSLLACSTAHVAAGGRPYRALVMCPDHLLSKWGREIRETIPGAKVTTFKDWKEVEDLSRRGIYYLPDRIPGTQPTSDATYSVCTGPDTLPESGPFEGPWEYEDRPLTPGPLSGIAQRLRRWSAGPEGAEWFLMGRDQSKFEPTARLAFAKKRVPIMEAKALRDLRKKGATWAELTTIVAACPRCGKVVVDREGNPIRAAEISPKSRPECKAEGCDEPLWQYTRKPYRWAPARILHSKMRGAFDYLVIDEMHEEKSATSAQANAAGKLIASSKKVIALTGTLIGGYANHVFPMVMRLDAGSLVADGIGWKSGGKFDQKYGRIETTIYTTSGRSRDDDRNSHSMGSKTRPPTKRVRPGVMPQLFGDHLIDKTIFLTLEEVRDGLPDLFEEIIPVDMDAEQASAYDEMATWFRTTIKQQLAMGNKRLLGTMLSHLLCYPDQPFGWDRINAGEDGSFDPGNLDADTVRPKEEALVALCRREKDLGRQTWVYIQMTQVKDVGPRLVKLLAKEGIKAGYLKSDVDRRKREEWIYKHGKDLDVVISHPKLVETGLDLFAKDGNHNFSTLVYYETGYNLFTLRQSSRRSWRIGQPLPCKTVFLYYRGTMQEQAMTLMGKKMAAAEALEGKFSAEGLAAMAGEDDATMALAKALLERVDAPADRNWSRTLGFSPAQHAAPEPEVKPLKLGGVTFTSEEIANLKRLHARLCGVGAQG